MATIKELSESLGISKVGLLKWIERHGYKDRLEKDGNKYVVPADVEQVIRANFDRREQKREKPINNTVKAESDITSEILALLREQLEAKDREIERLHNQVENLQAINADVVKALREANTLQAMQLTDGSEQVKEERHENGTEIAREKPSLWERIKRHF